MNSIGKGSCGEVFLGLNKMTESPYFNSNVAIKVISKSNLLSQDLKVLSIRNEVLMHHALVAMQEYS